MTSTTTSKSVIIIALALSLTCVCARGGYAELSKIYWTDSVLDVIRKAKLDGTMVTEVQAGLVNPVGIALSFDEATFCEGDLDGDDDIDQSDLGLLLAAYRISDGGDLDDDGDGDTDQADLGILLSVYGTSCS